MCNKGVKGWNVYDIRKKRDGSGWVVDGEIGFQTYPSYMTYDEVRKAYMQTEKYGAWVK